MNKFVAGFGIIISLALIGCGVIGGINKPDNVKPEQPKAEQPKNEQGSNANTENKNTLTCSASQYDETYKADCVTTMVMTFKDGELDKMDSKIVYNYTDTEAYRTMYGSMPERSGSSNMSGLIMNWELNDSNYTYTINMNAEVASLKANGWENTSGVNDYSYDSMLKYAKDQKLDCR